MCAIYGYVGKGPPTEELLAPVRQMARDRGRDGHGEVLYHLSDGVQAVLGSWRAAPTTEPHVGRCQPYDGIVHNGTIANDQELGNNPGAIDSEVLPLVLNRSSCDALAKSLARINGSYALAVRTETSVLLATNYKPLHYYAAGHGCYFASMERHLLPICRRGTAPVPVPAYSVLDLLSGETAVLPRSGDRSVLVVCSGGLDSTVAATILKHAGYRTALMHFLYGCRAEQQEVRRVQLLGQALEVSVHLMDLRPAYASMSGHSPLLTDRVIAESIAGAEYAHEWVPGRNLLFLSAAIAFAEANGMSAVASGVNLEESGGYPDNEEQLSHLLDRISPYAVQNGRQMRVLAPVGNLMKHEIVQQGLLLKAPLHLTWSCYQNAEKHCGHCGPCYMRRMAFHRCGAIDPCQPEDMP